MPRSRRFAEADPGGERGSASVEFLTAGLLLLLPLIALVLVLGRIQAGAFAVEAAAAQAARAIAVAEDPVAGREAAELAVAFALDDHGFARDEAAVVVACAPAGPCPSRDGAVTVRVELEVSILPLPGLLGASPPAVTVAASATRPVSRFAGIP